MTSRDPKAGAPLSPSVRPPGSHFAREGRAWSEISSISGKRYRLRLGGPFASGWLSGLCARLAEHAQSIETAHAWVSRDGTWVAELTFLDTGAAEEPTALAFLSFVATAGSSALKPRLDSARLERTGENGGSLLLQIEAPDMLGLLGAVLSEAARLGMHPLEMHIDTREGRVDDRIWFADAFGRTPQEDAEAELRRWLAARLTSALS